MSDARQAVQAARDVDAERYAVEAFATAERWLDQAARELELGNFRNARHAAREAKQQAIESRRLAIRYAGDERAP